MEAMLGISLYSYPYLKVAKTLSFLSSLMFSFFSTKLENKREEQVLPGRGWEVAQTMYTHE
jgi:hypothetical protein